MFFVLFLISSLLDQDSTPTASSVPPATALPTGKFVGLLFGCAACAAVIMLIIGVIALRFMKPSPGDEADVKKPLLTEA